MVLCVGKSTWSRCGIAINVTPIEAGFKGTVVIEIANLTSVPIKIYANMGIAQFMFFRGNKCNVSYDDRYGKVILNKDPRILNPIHQESW